MTRVDPVALAEVRELCASGEAKRLRLAARLSLLETARGAGIEHPTTVLRWENGERSPHGAVAIRYRALLGRLQGLVDTQPGTALSEHGEQITPA